MSFSEFENEHLRLAIISLLKSDPDYEANEHVLRSALGSIGLRVSQDALRTQCGWLTEQNLLTDKLVGNTLVIKLTNRGLDVAEGATTTPGVARPRPGAL